MNACHALLPRSRIAATVVMPTRRSSPLHWLRSGRAASVHRCSGAVFVLVSLQAWAAEPSFEGAARRLAPNVTAIASCSLPNGTGHYRTIVFNRGFEHVSSDVHLQWLEPSEDGPRLLKSVRVTELSSGSWSVDQPSIASKESCSMKIDATHTYGSQAARFVLRPTALGKYSVERIASTRRQ